MFPHPVAGQVGADVGGGGHQSGDRDARFGDVQQRTGLGVALAEELEVVGMFGRQDDEVGLGEARRQTRGVLGPGTLAAGSPDLLGCQEFWRRLVLHFASLADWFWGLAPEPVAEVPAPGSAIRC